jgi:ABC-type glutathione transport system ATPase component
MRPPDSRPPASGCEVALPGGARQTLLAGASLGLVGISANEVVTRFAADLGTALLMPDHADPLHAAFAVADQIAAALGGTRRAAVDRATDLLELTGVPEPHHRARARPHQLSRLDRQRVQLALALANAPAVIAAVDVTAGLDQAEAAALATQLSRLHARLGFTLVVATGQLEVAERMVDEIIVIEADRVVQRRHRRSAQLPAPSGPTAPSSSSST